MCAKLEASAYCRIKSVCTVSKLSSSLIPAPFLFAAVEAAAAFAAAGVNAAFTFIASSDKPRRLALQSIQLSYWYSYRGVYCSWLLNVRAFRWRCQPLGLAVVAFACF